MQHHAWIEHMALKAKAQRDLTSHSSRLLFAHWPGCYYPWVQVALLPAMEDLCTFLFKNRPDDFRIVLYTLFGPWLMVL